MQLLNPDDNSIVSEQAVPFAVEAGQTANVVFNIQTAALKESLLVCKVMAIGEGFSDGEQHYLPVLPDREYVTKTVPYTQHEPGVKSIDLTVLFPQGTTQQKLTVEYTNNPAWLMVQSLPIVGQPWEHSAIDQAASYYSNLLAKTLLAQNPQVKATFEQWKREDGSLSLLASSLSRNVLRAVRPSSTRTGSTTVSVQHCQNYRSYRIPTALSPGIQACMAVPLSR